MMEMATEANELPMQIVYILVLGFLITLIGGLFFPVIASLLGALIMAGGAFMGYSIQGHGGAGIGATGLPALHRELAKTHCGACGAPMRSNMMFCPVCGARQTQHA